MNHKANQLIKQDLLDAQARWEWASVKATSYIYYINDEGAWLRQCHMIKLYGNETLWQVLGRWELSEAQGRVMMDRYMVIRKSGLYRRMISELQIEQGSETE